MDRLQNHIPTWVSHNLNRLRGKRAIWVRVLTGVALIGAWGFLPLPIVGIGCCQLDLRCLLMTFQRCVSRWLVSCISLIARLKNGRVENRSGYLNLDIVFRPIPYDQQVVGLSKRASRKCVGSPYRSGRSTHWIKVKNPAAPAVKREAEGLGPLIQGVQ
jgi:hypothetical protein